MIRFLSIKHLAVVEKLELEFQPGLTVLTGETGAGKSIVLEALGLLVGGRATGDLVRTGESKAVVQATVEIDDEREMILRREVTSQGRSRAFIDDTLATVGALQSLGRRLVDLHGQHEHQALLDPRTHVHLVDAYGGLVGDVSAVGERFHVWRSARGALERARLSNRDKVERTEFLTFQRDEIDRVAPAAEEDESLGATRRRLANADRLVTLCTQAYGDLYERDDAVLARLGGIWHRLGELAALDPVFETYLQTRESLESQLEDVAFFLRSYAAGIEASPEQLAEVEARLSELERLKKKYGPRLEDVLTRHAALSHELEELARREGQLAELTQSEAAARQEFVAAATQLSIRRRAAGETLAGGLVPVLADLAIPQGRFDVQFEPEMLPEDAWSESGFNAVEFSFSANPGESLKPLAKVASGGELSRVMLALKTLASTDQPGKTLVFDEVDAGIGGAAADRVGSMLRALGKTFQVLCVTHLPQIAAHATSHCHVFKVVRKGRTVTRVEPLAEEGRVMEIARLMTGGASRRARESAQELLLSKQNAKGESERAKAKG